MHGHIHGLEYNIIYITMYIIHTLFVPVRKLKAIFKILNGTVDLSLFCMDQ